MLLLHLPPLESLSVTQISWVLLVLFLAVIFDIKSRTIPNLLVLAGIVVLLVLQWWEKSLQPLSLFIGVVTGLALWKLKFIGGGDSKLLMLVSAAFAPPYLLGLYVSISLIGSVQALIAITFKQKKNLPYAVAITLGTFVFLICSFQRNAF